MIATESQRSEHQSIIARRERGGVRCSETHEDDKLLYDSVDKARLPRGRPGCDRATLFDASVFESRRRYKLNECLPSRGISQRAVCRVILSQDEPWWMQVVKGSEPALRTHWPKRSIIRTAPCLPRRHGGHKSIVA